MKNTFVHRLRQARFTPGTPTTYPSQIGHDYLYDTHHQLRAYLLATAGSQVRRYETELKNRMEQDDVAYVEEHPTVRMLRGSLPKQASSEIRRGQARFVHYERIGAIYPHRGDFTKGKYDFTGFTHVRHLLCVPERYGMSYDPDAAPLIYQINILNAWIDKANWSLTEEVLSEAIAMRVKEHCKVIEYAAQSSDLDTDAFNSLFIQVVIYATYNDARDIDTRLAAATALEISTTAASMTDEDFENIQISNTCGITQLPENERADIQRSITDGKGVNKPPRTPRAAPGTKHYIIEFTDKRLGIDRNDKIFDAIPRGTAILDGERRDDGTVTFDYDEGNHKPAHPIRWRMVVDDGTGAYYVEPFFPEHEQEDFMAFLKRAWCRKPNLLFEGPPQILVIPKSYEKKNPGVSSRCSKAFGVDIEHPASGFASGISIARVWGSQAPYAIHRKSSITKGELVRWVAEQQLVAFGEGIFADSPERHLGAWRMFGVPSETHFAGMSVNTQAYLQAIGRSDGVDVIKQYWPRRSQT